ncbi:MAG: MBL fold metallo-hydrolase [Bacteroidetes bacterium]|nr:MBL fold metallo-hydrolase [Bacteroidota bacterium]
MTITYNSTNYFLIPCNDGFLLIDAGWHGKLEKFKRELDSFNIGINQIKYIFLTHHHYPSHGGLIDKKMIEKII